MLVCEVVFFGNYIFEIVYDFLLKLVNVNVDLFYCYVKLCKELFGLEELYMYDFYMLFFDDVNLEFIYEEVKEFVFEVFKLFGDEY